MLAVTKNAIEAIKQVTPSGAGVRLYTAELPSDATQHALQAAVAEDPAPGDRLLDADGAHLFLDPSAAALLDDMVLDAKLEGASVRFAVAERA